MANVLKVSGTNWLCMQVGSRWIPICQLTSEQIKSYDEVARMDPHVRHVKSRPPCDCGALDFSQGPLPHAIGCSSKFVGDKS